MLNYEDFLKIDMRVGTVVEVNDFPEARNPAYQVHVDFGELGIKKSSAQITTHYNKEDLIGKQVIAVVNFPKKQIAKFMSECLILGVMNEDNSVILLNPEQKVENGLRIL